MAARILVALDFIRVAVLLPPVPVEVLADVVQRQLQRVGTDAEISVGQHDAGGVDIGVELQPHAELLAHLLHHVVHGAGVLRLVGLGGGIEAEE